MTIPARLRPLLGCLLLAAVVLAIYSQVTHHSFVAFDTNFITQNPHVLRGLSAEGFRWSLTASYSANWLPLTWWSHMLDVELFGLDPGRHNLVSVALHALASMALFLALARLTKAPGRSWFVAALFAVHPLHVESVAWIIERKDVLSALFGWLCLYAYAAYAERPGALRYGAALACLALGLLSKSMLVTWPAVLLLLDFWPLRRESLGLRRLVLEKLPFLALSIGAAAATWFAQAGGGAVKTLDVLPLSQRLANAPVALAAYLRKAFWPTDLAFFYPHPCDRLPATEVAIALGVLALVTLVALLQWRRARYPAVGWLFFLGTLVPVIGIVQVGGQAHADRYTYIPLTGVFVWLTWQACDAWPRALALRAALGGALIAALAFVAHRQTATWRDTESLCARALAVTESNHMAHIVLGNSRIERGDLDGGIAELQQALAISPREAEACGNLAVALYRKRDMRAAEIRAREAVAIAPTNPRLHNQLASILLGQARCEEALSQANEALRLDPRFAHAMNTSGGALEGLGRTAEAKSAYERALRLDPTVHEARFALVRLARAAGDAARVEALLREVLQWDPQDVRAARELARELVETRRAEARAVLERALALRPQSAALAADYVWLLAEGGDTTDVARAIEIGERASANGAVPTVLLRALARAYAAGGEFERALVTARRGLEQARARKETALEGELDAHAAAYAAGRVGPAAR
ncbi:MAG: tetratricopeptide repeat protein [Planctomycetota bacterium]